MTTTELPTVLTGLPLVAPDRTLLNAHAQRAVCERLGPGQTRPEMTP